MNFARGATVDDPAAGGLTGSGDGDLLLCCLLWAKDGDAAGLEEYEDKVLALMPDHGGAVLQRVCCDRGTGEPAELQVIRFPAQSSLDSFLADPRRLALAGERDRVVGRTELFPVREGHLVREGQGHG